MIDRNSSVPNSHHRGERAVLAVFPPSVNVIEPKSNREADLEVNGHTFNVKWIGQGHLGDVRNALLLYATRIGNGTRRRPHLCVRRSEDRL